MNNLYALAVDDETDGDLAVVGVFDSTEALVAQAIVNFQERNDCYPEHSEPRLFTTENALVFFIQADWHEILLEDRYTVIPFPLNSLIPLNDPGRFVPK